MTASKCLVKMSEQLLAYRGWLSKEGIDDVTFKLAKLIWANQNDIRDARFVLYRNNGIEVSE